MLVTTSRRAHEPAVDLLANLRRFNRLVDDAFVWPFQNGGGNTIASAWIPACDVYEDKDSIRIAMEVPGVKAEDVKVNLENQVLTIRGEKRQATAENGVLTVTLPKAEKARPREIPVRASA